MARVLRHDAVERESPLDMTLLQGMARGERMDLIVQKATELGVTRIVPVLAERSVVKLDARQRERKLEHWQAIAISACEQCGRNRVPEVGEPTALGDALARAGARTAGVACSPPTRRIRWRPPRRAALPSPSCCSSAPKAASRTTSGSLRWPMASPPAGSGPRVMRTETAGLAALATLQAMAGDFAVTPCVDVRDVRSNRLTDAAVSARRPACWFTRADRNGA